MSRKRFHGLRRIKFRMTWNKYNLYNLSRMSQPNFYGTYFQQKWAAKSASRAYHGEQIREKQWQRMFTSQLNSVIPMDHRYLAEFDGSELAAGRGSGLERMPEKMINKPNNFIPYMNMTYAPTERRLDVAIFRALFASSARQARQFVTHGKVKVNGKKMPYPGYLLNPGDMFQVEPERVLFATGQPKTKEQIRAGRELLRRRRIANTKRAERRAAKREKQLQAIADKKVAEELEGQQKPRAPRPVLDDMEARKQRKADLQELAKQIKAILESQKSPPPAKRRKSLREVNKEIKNTMSLLGRRPIAEINGKVDDISTRMAAMYPRNPLVREPRKPNTESETTANAENTETSSSETPEKTAEEKKHEMRQALIRYRENPVDESKPYATPWAPRPYMSAFAFIPRYLEVNHNICSAVYLRHPVARPGLAEVPTPFSPEQLQLAFNWYLRRR